ncbi:sulfatase-like hydrolase/transferase, partial [Aquiflexum sp.]|uniref:sulfatase-like hydrolase/transferase n=1 Tax=Aquiflexum sp. TaxID=1872584 RepID=UPI0035932BCF
MIKFTVSACSLIVILMFSCSQKEPVKPNVLFLFTDDQRADALSLTGNKHIQTPNIDQLAREGSFFTNAYVMGGHHGAICAPSRAMMLSGKSLFHVYDRLKDVETMPMRFG